MTTTLTSIPGAAPAAATPQKIRHHAALLDQRLIDLDDRITAEFLHHDLTVRCNCAVATGLPTLICTATLPTEERAEIVRNWRKGVLGQAAGSEIFSKWLESLAGDVRAEVLSGAIPLHALDVQSFSWHQESTAQLNGLRGKEKVRLRAAVADACLDVSGDFDASSLPIWPRAICILGTGEAGIFKNRHAAVKWGRDSGEAWMLCEMDAQKTRINPAPDSEILRRAASGPHGVITTEPPARPRAAPARGRVVGDDMKL